MRMGVPKEIKTHEYRVGMTPGGVREAVRHGHAVWVETGAGMGIGLSDAAYEKAGATVVSLGGVVAEARGRRAQLLGGGHGGAARDREQHPCAGGGPPSSLSASKHCLATAAPESGPP